MIKWPWKAIDTSRNPTPPWKEALTIPVLSTLSVEQQDQLTKLADVFLQQKKLLPVAGCELDELKCARIALLFCLPVLELGLEWLDGFSEVLIYPEPATPEDEKEGNTALLVAHRTLFAGQQKPVILNWLDIHDSFDASGFNLIIHAVAHQLDKRNGDDANGVPLLPLREQAGWEYDLRTAMALIQDEIDLVGENAASIDACTATDPAECFAVLSEYFFSAPELFAPRFPALWQRFCHFYRQDPLVHLNASNNAGLAH